LAIFSWESLYTIQVGGLGVAVTMLAEELARQGHEVSYFTRGAPGQPQYMHINGVDYHALQVDPSPSSYSFSLDMSGTMVESLHAVERHSGRFDLIHGHDWLVVDALQRLKAEGRSVVMTYHSTEFGRNGGRFGEWAASKNISDRERYAGEIADQVTTVSHHMLDELGSLYGIPRDMITVIPNALDPGRYKLDISQTEAKERYGIPPGTPMVLFVGRMEYQKGPDILVEAIPRVLETRPDAVFVFVGGGRMRGSIEQRAWELGVAGSVRFLGFLPYWDFVENLNSCDIVCIPSRNEPFGMVLLEAWAAGKAVVASDMGGLAENIDDGINGLKVGPQPASIADGLIRLLDDPDLSERLAREGRVKLDQFTWQESAARLIRVYDKALSAHRA
jgi:glycosyltransferase involved in cell wall biosynthesis